MLVNVINGIASSHLTGFEVTVKGGHITSVVKGNFDAARIEQVHARLKGAAPVLAAPAAAEVDARIGEPAKVIAVPVKPEAAREGRRKATVR